MNATLELIDQFLKETTERDLISSNEVRDRLLDLRLSLLPEEAN